MTQPIEPRKSSPPARPTPKLATATIRPTASQRKALGVFAFIAVLSLVLLSLPVASGLFLGTLCAFSLLRVYDNLTKKLHRPDLAALLLALASALLIIGVLTIFFYFVIERGIVAANSVARGFDPGGPLRAMLERIDEATRNSPIGPIDLAGRVKEGAATAASKLTSWAAALAGVTLNAALLLFFTIMTTFFVLRHWTELVLRAERLLPLHPAHTRLVLAEFQKVGGEVFIGTLLTGLAQGTLAGIGYAVAGVPEAALLGALTAICSLVPAIGTLLVWVPVGIILAIAGHVGAGIFVLVWGGVVVGIVCDYVIRPKLVGGKGHVPTLVTFIALFGGVEVFGLVGLIVGPVIASVALALLQTYDREMGDAGLDDSLNTDEGAGSNSC
ncbi:MAG TPA: AI-2E family transporter [Polyangiales bacterium]